MFIEFGDIFGKNWGKQQKTFRKSQKIVIGKNISFVLICKSIKQII